MLPNDYRAWSPFAMSTYSGGTPERQSAYPALLYLPMLIGVAPIPINPTAPLIKQTWAPTETSILVDPPSCLVSAHSA